MQSGSKIVDKVGFNQIHTERMERERSIGGAQWADKGETAAGCASEPAREKTAYRHVRVPIEVEARHNFSEALAAVLAGCRITRASWNAGGQWVSAQYPDSGGKMSGPYMFIKNSIEQLVPWVPSQGDLFAYDWAIIPHSPL